jgi:hypothetical protein
MTMPLDPYAPPTASAEAVAPVAGRGRVSDYAAERRSLPLVIFLSVITLGVYPALWLLRRQPFLDQLDADQKLGTGAPIALLVANVAAFGTFFFEVPQELDRPISLGLGAAALVLSFRVAAMLRSDFARSGRMIDVKGVWVFFLGVWYLQHVINKAADAPARIVGAKKRKKKKAPSADADVKAGAGADADAGADAGADAVA